MSPRDPGLDAIEADLARSRAEMAGTVAEIARRLRPQAVVDTAIEKISGRATDIASAALDTAKRHGGQATLFGAGALLAFDIGRRTSDPSQGTGSAEGEIATVSVGDAGGGPDEPSGLAARPKTQAFEAIGNIPTVLKYWGGGLAAAAVGYSVGAAVPVSEAEKRLLGDAAHEVRTEATAFWQEHAEGARQMSAQAFGLAGVAAAALGTMAAFAEILGKGRSAQGPSARDAS
jgi:Protein of unknown function (DUF3618)